MGGGGGGKSTTTESKEIRLPAWVEAASQKNYQRAEDVANRPFWENPYAGSAGVAGLDPAYYAAYGMMGDLGQGQQGYADASQALTGMLGYNPQQIRAGMYDPSTLAGRNMDPYLNPELENVVGRTTANMERSGQLAQNQIASDAGKAKSFGGSRQAVQQGVQQAETTRAIGDTEANLRQQAWDKAMGYAGQDVASENTAASANAQAWQKAQEASRQNEINALTAKTGAANQLTQTSDAQQAATINQINTMVAMGQISQEQAQRMLDAEKQKAQAPRDYPLEQLNILLASLGMSPYGHTETGTSTTKSSGGGGGLGQALGMGGNLLSLFAGLSDREEKTDIKVVGQHPSLPVKIYAYRYKGDPKTYPKTIGPMAQDIEKVRPDLVRKVGKRRIVDYRALAV